MAHLSAEDINTILSRKLKTEKFHVISFEEDNSDYLSTGYLSTQGKMCITYEIGEKVEKLHIFIKMVPQMPYHKKVVLSTGAFTKEVIVFELFLNDLKRKHEGHPIPICYLARPNEVVVLNDLSQEGFTNLPLHETFTVEHCEKVIDSLVKIHSASLIFEMKNKCKINDFIPVLKKETIFSQDKNNIAVKAVLVGHRALRAIKNKYFPHYSKELTDKVFKHIESLSEKLVPSIKYPNVLSHTDLWTNNIMFRYDNNSKVVEACIIDFQLASYKAITYDLQMIIYTCTDKELRNKHYKHLLNYYYEQLSKEMTLEGVNLSNVLSWTDLENVSNETLPVLLAIAPSFLHFVLMPDEIIRDVLKDEDKWRNYYEEDRTEFALQAMETYPAYRKRLTEAITDLFEYFSQ